VVSSIDLVKFTVLLEKARDDRGLSRRAVSRLCGFSPSTYTRLMDGKSVEADSFVALLRWAGIELSDVLMDAVPALKVSVTAADVVGMIRGMDGVHHDGLGVFVAVRPDVSPKRAVVVVSDAEGCERRFRVTVEEFV